MNLDFSEDQTLLRHTVDRLVAQHHAFNDRSRIAASAAGWSREAWARFADLGLLMLPYSEAQGGMGADGIETLIVGEAFGRALVTEPYLSSSVMVGAALRFCPPSEAAVSLIAALIAGGRIAAFVDDGSVWLQDGRLHGTAPMVLGADAADDLLVGAQDGTGALSLVLVAADAAGVSRVPYHLHGGGMAASVTFEAAAISATLAGPHLAPGLCEAVRRSAIAFLTAEACGACQAVFDLTVEYLKTRVQFGKPLGTNQALQHRAAEMLVELEQLRSAALYGAMMLNDPDAAEADRAISSCKIVTGRAARLIGQQSVQLHGGIGVTQEYAAGHYFKRLTAISLLFGDADHHVARLAELGGHVSGVRGE